MFTWMSFKSILFFSVWLYLFINDGISYWIQRANSRELLQKNISDESVSCLGIYSREIRDTINKTNSIIILVELTVFHEKHLSVFLRENSEVQLKRLWHKENAYKCFHTWNEAHLPLLRYSWRRKKKWGRGEVRRRGERRGEGKRNVTYVILTLFNLKLYFA